MFAGMARSLPQTGDPKALALLVKIKLGWKWLPGTNTLAYMEYGPFGNFDRERFYNIGPRILNLQILFQ
jgi:hypothetical protein